ncbi:unnamed protein product [Acanthoscelides obtectus]|uniref:Uncharacterized protein n=1 Tax=Acanthoscelides obtectus TaxID=200917 RepID=A0A9P0MDP9_ACAOB|nr:unnamed protein product [Acanthoscelides obtectus]CAK1645081.1 hypothetical protein AOBTE_LOCUS14017 [Acanthoscelides obtectus]
MFSRSTRHVKENPNFADTLYCQNYDTTMRSHDPLLQLSPENGLNTCKHQEHLDSIHCNLVTGEGLFVLECGGESTSSSGEVLTK